MNAEHLPSHLRSQPRPEAEARPAPVDLSLGKPENFPLEVLPPLLKGITSDLASVYQLPVCLPAMSALAVLSAAAGKAFVCRGGYREKITRLNLYVVPVVERGLGKGLTGETLMSPFANASDELAKASEAANAPKRQEVAELRKSIKTKKQQDDMGEEKLSQCRSRIWELEEQIDRVPTLWIQDATSEALARVLSQNGESLFCFSTEGGNVIDVALGKYTNGSDINLLLSAYSGDRVSYHRIGRPDVTLREPTLSLLLMVQGEVLRKVLRSDEAFGRGLTARMMIFDSGAERKHDTGGGGSFLAAGKWADLIDAIMRQRSSGQQEMRCSEAAREIFTAFHNEAVDFENRNFPDLAGESSRWRENAIKVAGLLALSELRQEVGVEDARAAVAVVKWCGFNYFKMLSSSRRSRLEEEIGGLEKILRPRGLVGMTLSELDDHGYDRARLEKIFAASGDTFERCKVVDPSGPNRKSGRPAEMVRLKFMPPAGRVLT